MLFDQSLQRCEHLRRTRSSSMRIIRLGCNESRPFEIVTARAVILCVAALMCAFATYAGPSDPKEIKSGLEPADWAYRLPEGVTRRDSTYYSDDVPCYAKMFFPKGFSTAGRTPA